MAALQVEVTHSLTFLSKLKNMEDRLYRLIFQEFNTINNMRSDQSGYNGQIRTRTKKFKEKMELEFSTLSYDYKLFQSEMTDVILYRNTDIVIYAMGNFHNYLMDLQTKQKKTDKLCKLIKINMEQAERRGDVVKQIGLFKLYGIANYLNTLLIRVMNRLYTVTGEEKKEA